MNKLIFWSLLFLLHLTISKLNAQPGWYQQSSGINNITINGVCFIDADIGYAVGGDRVFRTTNGGANWSNQIPSAGFLDLRGISFTNAGTGTIVGFGGTILRTTNGGMDWISQSSGTTRTLHDVFFTDANTGTAVGGFGTILRTTNGGELWTSQSSGTTNELWSVFFVDASTGWAAGDNAVILHTSNGGANWVEQSDFFPASINGLSFINSDFGIAVGGVGIILRTTNGGTDWALQITGTNYLTDISLADLLNGWAVGQAGTILHTTDGGITWTPQTSGTAGNLFGVSFTDVNNGTAVGQSGIILRTTTGGIIPVELVSFSAAQFNNTVTLSWQTASETNNYGFDIERSTGENDWRIIGFKEGHGTSTTIQNYSFPDNLSEISSAKFYYRLKQIDYDGSFEYSDIIEVVLPPSDFELLQNYPNPFNPITNVKFSVPVESSVIIKIFNLIGQEVSEVVNGNYAAGSHSITIDGSFLSSSLYFYTFSATGNDGKDFTSTKKMLLLK